MPRVPGCTSFKRLVRLDDGANTYGGKPDSISNVARTGDPRLPWANAPAMSLVSVPDGEIRNNPFAAGGTGRTRNATWARLSQDLVDPDP